MLIYMLSEVIRIDEEQICYREEQKRRKKRDA